MDAPGGVLNNTGLLVGAGSIGRRHLDLLEARFPSVVVVDSNPEVVAELQGRLVTTRAFTSIPDALRSMEPEIEAANTVAVIANWGPQHRATFDALADVGVRRILVEKPMASSMADATHIADRAMREGIRLTVGHQRRYMGMADELLALGAERLGGEPVQVVVHGGAQCLITNGSHWVDFSCMLFGSYPARAWSNARSRPINPRSSTLTFWGGTAVWDFGEDRTLAITYSNDSSVAQTVSIYYRNGRVDLTGDGRVHVGARASDELARDGRVTRVGVVHEMRGAWVGESNEDASYMSQLSNLTSTDNLVYGPAEASRVAVAGLAALASSQLGRAVDLPVSEEFPLFRHNWWAS